MSFRRLLPLAVVATLISAAASARVADLTDQPRRVALPPAGTAVPMRLVSGKPVVDVRIDGRGPFPFFLDTGAGATVLDSAFAAELALPAIGPTQIGDPSAPEGIAAVQHRVDRLEIGDARFESFFAVAFDRSGLYRGGLSPESSPRGVLGMPLFRDCLLTLDYPAGRVRLSAGELPPADGREIVDYRPTESDLFGVPLRVAGLEQLMTLDSGSPGTISFPDSYRTTLPLVAPAREIGRGRTVGGEAIVYSAQLDGDVVLGGSAAARGDGGIRLERPEVRFFGRLTHGNLGSGFLARYAVTIDQRTRRLRLVPGVAAAGVDVRVGERSGAGGLTSAAGPPADSLARFAGTYGERRITLEEGRLVLQRLSGPQGAGPKIPLTAAGENRFALEGQSEPRLEFVVAPDGTVKELRIQTREGSWESAPRQ